MAAADDPHDLQRFVLAQEGVHAQALAELRAGRKQGHWIWFVLPQLRGLGHSPLANRYGLGSLAEARAYLAHPVLGPRLADCVQALLAHRGHDVVDMLGAVDALKLRSCLTLFHAAAGEDAALFDQALATFFGGQRDPLTLAALRDAGGAAH